MKIQPPITRRIQNIGRDTYQVQRLGYPIYHTRTRREPKASPLAMLAAYGASALIAISTIAAAWHYLNH